MEMRIRERAKKYLIKDFFLFFCHFELRLKILCLHFLVNVPKFGELLDNVIGIFSFFQGRKIASCRCRKKDSYVEESFIILENSLTLEF